MRQRITQMTFTDTTILAALAALAIPLAIHLMGRRRARKVMLPTMRFAGEAHAAARGRTWLVQASLLAARLAAVALLVLALAGPHWAPREHTGGRTPEGTSAAPRPAVYSRGAEYGPVRVLVVDAAGPETARIRSADLVAATFAAGTDAKKGAAPVSGRSETGAVPSFATGGGAAAEMGTVPFSQRREKGTAPISAAARVSAAQVNAAALQAADVVFWVGPQAPPDTPALTAWLSRGGALVWVPSDAAQPPEAALAGALDAGHAAVQEVADGATIDPAGYTSDLVAAFEGGTSGDLGAPVFRRRLVFANAPAALRFRDGPAAIAEARIGNGRALLLAAGPAPAWGDLASRAEFVVLAHSLAEALAPQRAPLAPREYTGGETAEGMVPAAPPPVYSPGPAEYSPGAKHETPAARDLALWFVLAWAAALAAESWVAARTAPRALTRS